MTRKARLLVVGAALAIVSALTRAQVAAQVITVTPGTLTRSNDTGQRLTREVTTGAMQLITTGWTRTATTVTVSFTNGWDLGVDDITYRTAS